MAIYPHEGLLRNIVNDILPLVRSASIDRDDLLQEAYIHMLHVDKEFRPGTTKYSTFMAICVKRHLRDYIRWHAKPLQELPTNICSRSENDTTLIDLVRTLPPQERFVLEEFFFASRSVGDIASDCGCKVWVVSKYIKQGLALLKELL